MGLKEEGTAILRQAGEAINQALQNEVANIAKETIKQWVDNTVYTAYEPGGRYPYIRRKTNGGLTDISLYDVTVDEATHTLTVSDDRPEVEVVESGEGYTWEDSKIFDMQPFPRPYFENAEWDVATGEEASTALENALNKL